MANDAIHANPRFADLTITNAGSDFLWAVFAIMLFSDLALVVWSLTIPRGRRIFHQIPIAILTTASIAYFSMASDLGGTGVLIEFARGNTLQTTRAIWYVRYIDWVITTPLLLLELLLATGLPVSDIFMTIFMDEVMIIAGLVGALVVSAYKWGYFVGGTFALFYVWYQLVVQAPASALVLGLDARRVYFRSALYLSLIWALYPIAWGLSDGGNVISPDSEMIFYGVLDVLAKPIFIFYHLWSLRGIDIARFGLFSGKATEAGLPVVTGYDAGHGNKNVNGNVPVAATTGAMRGTTAGTVAPAGLFGRRISNPAIMTEGAMNGGVTAASPRTSAAGTTVENAHTVA